MSAARLTLAALALMLPGCDFFDDNCGTHPATFYGVTLDRDTNVTWGEKSAPVSTGLGTSFPGCVATTAFGSASYAAYLEVVCVAADDSAIDFVLDVDADAWETMSSPTPVSASWAYNHASATNGCGAGITASPAVTATLISSAGSRTPPPESATADYERTWLLEVDTTKLDAAQRLSCADSVDLLFNLVVTQDRSSFLYVKDAADCY